MRDFGFFVPQAGRVKNAHHGLSRPFQPRNVQQLQGIDDYRQLEAVRALTLESDDEPPEAIGLISSEGFQNCRPGLVQMAYRDFQAQIVVYLRNQLEYLASSYAQRVHATDYTGSIQVFFKDVYLKGNHYASFLETWEEHFPKQLLVRRYQPSNIVEDYAENVLQIPVDAFSMRQSLSNPSLNSVVTQFKCELNRRKPKDAPTQLEIYPILPGLNALFPGPKFVLPPETVSDLVDNCRESDNEVATRYFGDKQLFDYSDFPTHPESPIRDIQFEAMYSAMLQLLRETNATYA
ncbi:hypothetical protein [Congregibacter litoralis]|uniref:hypothetical protein n=1 Tax=Congregibacter litoralis TaxID=393662 RepID=UPI0002EA0922|nr:hypothetical protein [Congregibacter litoralis]